jgi:hypothetical protein
MEYQDIGDGTPLPLVMCHLTAAGQWISPARQKAISVMPIDVISANRLTRIARDIT